MRAEPLIDPLCLGYTWYDAFNMQQTQDFPAETHLYTADDERLWTLRYTAGQPIRETWTLRDRGHALGIALFSLRKPLCELRLAL